MTRIPSKAELKKMAAISDSDIAEMQAMIDSLSGVVKYVDGQTVKRIRAEAVKPLWDAQLKEK